MKKRLKRKHVVRLLNDWMRIKPYEDDIPILGTLIHRLNSDPTPTNRKLAKMWTKVLVEWAARTAEIETGHSDSYEPYWKTYTETCRAYDIDPFNL